MSFLATIPAPARQYERPEAPEPSRPAGMGKVAFQPPPYGQRAGFVPRKVADFGDGECVGGAWGGGSERALVVVTGGRVGGVRGGGGGGVVLGYMWRWW